jgi:hypothetical protein
LFILTALAASAQSTVSGQPVTAAIDATKTGPPISPYLYGQFLEHVGSLIYNSLWCEMLDDRKFYYAVTNRPAEDPNAGLKSPHSTRCRACRTSSNFAKRLDCGAFTAAFPPTAQLASDTRRPQLRL